MLCECKKRMQLLKISSDLQHIVCLQAFFCILFWRSTVCWPLFCCLCRPFCIFERCLDSNPESCRMASRRATNLATHLPKGSTHNPYRLITLYPLSSFTPCIPRSRMYPPCLQCCIPIPSQPEPKYVYSIGMHKT